MKIDRTFRRCRFSRQVIADALDVLKEMVGGELKQGNCTVDAASDESREYDSIEEWLIAYSRPNKGGLLSVRGDAMGYGLLVSPFEQGQGVFTLVAAAAPTEVEAERLLQPFEDARERAFVPKPEAPAEAVPEPEPVKIFLGHGHSEDWRDLKDHHQYDVQAFESGSRAGHAVRDVRESALRGSSIAFLILSGEDEQASGDVRARQNVIHELGLFQGQLGWERGVAILEEGVELPSNMDGVVQIRYARGGIRETFGEVLGVLRREFRDRR